MFVFQSAEQEILAARIRPGQESEIETFLGLLRWMPAKGAGGYGLG